MSVLFGTSWEAGSIAWYTAQSPALWSGNASIISTAANLHRNAAGQGGNYSTYQDDNWSCAAGTVVAGTARWLHYWMQPFTGGGNLNTQLARAGVLQLQIRFLANGKIELYRGATLLVPTGGTARFNPWVSHWAAIEATCQDAGGVLNVYIDNVLVASFAGDTKAHATLTDWDQWGWGSPWGSGLFNQNYIVDDVIVTDIVTGKVTEKMAYPILAAGDSAPLLLTPSTGVTHFNLIDEIPLSDADYNSTAITLFEDFYTWTAPPAAASILTVLFNARASNNAGLTQGQIGVRNVATTVYQPLVVLAVFPLFTDTTYILDTDPDTGLAWTNAGLATVRAGYRFAA